MNFLENNVFSLFFSLLENRDGHIAGLMEAKLEELGKMCPKKKMRYLTFYNFVFIQIFCGCIC